MTGSSRTRHPARPCDRLAEPEP